MLNSSSSPSQLINILLVDDRQDGLMALEAVLSQSDYNLVKAASGEEALACVLETHFALILMDVQMPGMDGFETATLIKQREKSKDIPIIFVTAISKETTFVYKGYQTGAVDYIFKPFDPLILKSKVAVYVDLYKKNLKIQQQAEQLRESDRRSRIQQLAALEVESFNRYRNLADSIPHIVWKCQPDGTLDYCNKVWTAYTGLTLEQSAGKGWQRVFHPEDLKELFRLWEEGVTEYRSFEAECRILSLQDSTYKWHLFRAVPELFSTVEIELGDPLAEAGKITAWVATSTEIDARKNMERDLVKAKDDAMKASVAKTNFLANMSHEIRTPLGIVLGYSELMSVPHLSQSDRENYLATIKRNGELLSDLIGDILDLSKIESGHMDIESKSCSLPELLSGILKPLQLKATQKGIGLKLALKTKIPDYIQTDPMRLRQILFNVIGNALKFTNAGVVDVQIAFEEASKRLSIQVSDSGIGITPAQERKIFNPFMQADSSTTRQFGGTGLGLSLSRRLARALNGDIKLVWSELGKGSTFEVTLAVDEVAGSQLIDASELVTHESQKSKVISKSSLRLENLHILLAEDSPDNQILVGRFLTAAGAKIQIANNGKEAIQMAQSRGQSNSPFDVILMDIQMPILDGYEATVQLRAAGYTIPIIALTAHAFEEERARCLRAGCDEHLTKPVNRDLLISTIKNCISNSKPKLESFSAGSEIPPSVLDLHP